MWLLDKLFGADELQADSDRLDAALRAQNALDAAKYGPQWLDETERNIETGRINASEEIAAGWEEGWSEGADNVRGFVGSTVESVVGTTFKLLPWYVWLALMGFVTWKLGLFKRRAKA